MRQEVNYLSEREEIFRGMLKDKNRDAKQSNRKILWKRNQKRLCHLCSKGSIYGEFRTKEMKQEGCRDLGGREG